VNNLPKSNVNSVSVCKWCGVSVCKWCVGEPLALGLQDVWKNNGENPSPPFWLCPCTEPSRPTVMLGQLRSNTK